MHDQFLKSSWDTLLYAGPMVAMLVLGFLRLDAIFSTPRRRPRDLQLARQRDWRDPEPASDPDGRPWREPEPGIGQRR